jgi:trehalose 6-phosphate synthase/phosphatase
MSARRLVVMSNRGPFNLHVTKQGLKREKTIGGLVTSVLPMLEKLGGVWIAWGEPEGCHSNAPGRPPFTLRYIQLTPEQVRGYYFGVSNSALWPLCHSFLGRVHYDNAAWQMYDQVNRLFAQAALEEADDDDLIWVHDYHLALVPYYVRQARPLARIACFWHIPFPASELFRTLPWRREILESLLSCDLFGVHIPEYAGDFMESAVKVLGAQVEPELVHYAGRITRVLARPIGIDYDAVARLARSAHIERRVQNIHETLREQVLVLGVERMDYTKGIAERLQAMECLLEQHSELHGRVTLVQIVTPSRMDVEAYRQKKREIDELVGRINGRFSDGIWIPVRYLYRSFSLAELIAYYRAADVALVTPLRDGLNLVAKEYVASRIQQDGVLILSEFAGVVRQLPEALLVNPYSTEDMAAALVQALQMPKEEQRERMQLMQGRIKEQDISWWANEFLDHMAGTLEPAVESSVLATMRQHLDAGGRLLLILDHDGTLVPIARTPEEARPDAALLELLESLTRMPAIHVVVLSGRALASLQAMLPVPGLILAGTYGAEIQMPGHGTLTCVVPENVHPTIGQVRSAWAELIALRSGFFLEDKGLAVALHARFADQTEADFVLPRARAKAEQIISPERFRLLGGDRFLEVAPITAHKGRAVEWLLDRETLPDVLPVYFGDDDKDEEAFAVIRRRGGIAVVVGQRQLSSPATERLPSPIQVREWLRFLAARDSGV